MIIIRAIRLSVNRESINGRQIPDGAEKCRLKGVGGMKARSATSTNKASTKVASPSAKRAAPLTVRELYRVLHFKFVPYPLRPRDLLKLLKTLLPYSHWSERRLRRLIERTLTDPRASTMLSVTIIPLDFVVVEVGILQAGELLFDHAQELGFDVAAAKRTGVVAELLGHLFCADGLPPIAPVQPKRWQTISLGLLRETVRSGKTVVLFAGGEEKARAVWAVYQAKRAGGLLFNTLVTDESCANALLRMAQQHHDGIVAENLQWRRERMKFWAVHLQFAATPHLEHRSEVAKQLNISRELASELLDESLYGNETSSPMVRLKVFPPNA